MGSSYPEPVLVAAAGLAHEAGRRLREALGEAENPAHSWYYVLDRSAKVTRAERLAEGASPAELHAEWCTLRRTDGYVHGQHHDAGARTDPRLVPWENLPPEIRALDELEQAVVLDFCNTCATHWPA